jgi:transposase
VLVQEVFGWRRNPTRKQLGSLAGPTPTPCNSGGSKPEQGIGKAASSDAGGTGMAVGAASAEHEADEVFLVEVRASRRQRKFGIVALARKLFVALYQHVKRGKLPKGAATVEWRDKVSRPRPRSDASEPSDAKKADLGENAKAKKGRRGSPSKTVA